MIETCIHDTLPDNVYYYALISGLDIGKITRKFSYLLLFFIREWIRLRDVFMSENDKMVLHLKIKIMVNASMLLKWLFLYHILAVVCRYILRVS